VLISSNHIHRLLLLTALTSITEKMREFDVCTILLDSPEFNSLTQTKIQPPSPAASPSVTQSDVPAILYSFDMTRKVKGVMRWYGHTTMVVNKKPWWYVILSIAVIQTQWYLQYILSRLDQPWSWNHACKPCITAIKCVCSTNVML